MASSTTPTGITVPAGGDPFDPAGDIGQLAASLAPRTITPVANTTDRGRLVAELAALGRAPSSTRPLYVHRTDATPGRELEYTTNGTSWASVLPAQIIGRLWRSSNQNIPATTWTPVTWSGSESTGFGWSSPYFVIATAGWYRIDGAARFFAGTGGRRGVGVSFDSSEPAYTNQTLDSPGTNEPVAYSTPSVLRKLSVGALVGMWVYQTSSATIAIQEAMLSIERVL